MRAATVGRLGLELWIFLFVALAGTTLLGTQPALRLAAVAVFALPVLAWAVARVRGRPELLDVAILVGIGAHLAVSLASLDRQGSLEASALVVAYAAAFWLARHLGADPELRRVVAIAVGVALTAWLVLIGITWVAEKVADVQAFGWPPGLDAYQPYVWGSVNTPPMLLLLVTPFVAWLPERGMRRLFLGVLAVVAVIVVPFSVGRAAWLGIAVAVLSLAAMSRLPALARARRVGTAGMVAVAMAGALAVWLLVTRFDGLLGALDSRVRLWQQAGGLFASDPLTGSGPGTFSWARLSYVPDFTDRVGASAAHNVPMQTLAEGGLLLGAALAFIVAAWGWQVIRGRRHLDGPRRVAVATLIGFAAFSLLDDFSFLPAVTVVVIVLAAWSLPPRVTADVAPGGPGWRGLVVPVVLVVSAVISAPAVASLGLMRIGLADARSAAVDGDWDAALRGFRAAASAQPANALHWMSVGLAEHHLGRDDAAIEAYRVAERVSPGDPRPWGALAALSDGSDAIDLLREAARRSNDPQYAYRLASALSAEGQAVEAAEHLAIASVIQPALYATVSEPMRSSVRSELPAAIARVGSVEGRDPREVAWNAALAAGEMEPDAPIQWQVAGRVRDGDVAGARALLEEAELREARSVRTWQAAVAVAALTCDRAERERAEANIERLGRESIGGDHRVAERRPGVYREPDLGDYQPLSEASLPSPPEWPLGLIEVPDCG
jgi:O-antigen ligase/tetratricopeptide (TPR) repeat protein